MAKDDWITEEDIRERLHTLSPDLLLPTAKAGLVLGVGKSALDHWRSKGLPPPFVVVGDSKRPTIRYKLGTLQEYLSGRTVTSTAQAREVHKVVLGKMVPFDPWDDLKHPFWIRGHFVIDFALSKANFAEFLADPTTKVCWLTLTEALSKPWTNEALRKLRIGQQSNRQGIDEGRLISWLAELKSRMESNLANLPPSQWQAAEPLTPDKRLGATLPNT